VNDQLIYDSDLLTICPLHPADRSAVLNGLGRALCWTNGHQPGSFTSRLVGRGPRPRRLACCSQGDVRLQSIVWRHAVLVTGQWSLQCCPAETIQTDAT